MTGQAELSKPPLAVDAKGISPMRIGQYAAQCAIRNLYYCVEEEEFLEEKQLDIKMAEINLCWCPKGEESDDWFSPPSFIQEYGPRIVYATL